MSGTRPLTEQEQIQVLNHLKSIRDKALFILGLKTGFRISELLSLRVMDVYENGTILSHVKVAKRNTKTKASRSVVLHPQAKAYLLHLILELKGMFNEDFSGEVFLFQSQQGENQAIERTVAHKLLKAAYKASGLTGAVATHSMRKSFAKVIYERLNHDLVSTSKALGHRSILTTISYLDFNNEAIEAAILV